MLKHAGLVCVDGGEGKALLSMGWCVQKMENLLESSVWAEGMRRLKNKCCPLAAALRDGCD